MDQDEDNIIFNVPDSTATSRGYVPWKPTFFVDGGTNKVRLNLGTVNNVVPSNWNDAFTVNDEAGAFKFAVLTVTSGSGIVTGATLSMDGVPPAADSVTKDVPPAQMQIVLGAMRMSQSKMILSDNIDMVAEQVFIEPIQSPALGAEATARWWRWNTRFYS